MTVDKRVWWYIYRVKERHRFGRGRCQYLAERVKCCRILWRHTRKEPKIGRNLAESREYIPSYMDIGVTVISEKVMHSILSLYLYLFLYLCLAPLSPPPLSLSLSLLSLSLSLSLNSIYCLHKLHHAPEPKISSFHLYASFLVWITFYKTMPNAQKLRFYYIVIFFKWLMLLHNVHLVAHSLIFIELPYTDCKSLHPLYICHLWCIM